MTLFKYGDRTDAIANIRNMYIEFYHVNTGKSLRIKAALNNFEDRYNTDYSTDFFVMHTEPIRKWKSTVREISFSLRMPANGVAEAKDNLAKMSLLARMLYGEQIKEGSGFVPRVGGGPIFKIRFLNWIAGVAPAADGASGFVNAFGSAETSGLLGYISGFSFKPGNLTDGFIQEPNSSDGRLTPSSPGEAQSTDIYPRFVDLSLSFYPVHIKSPAWIDGEFNYENFPYGANVEDADISKQTHKNQVAALGGAPTPSNSQPAAIAAAAAAPVVADNPADVASDEATTNLLEQIDLTNAATGDTSDSFLIPENRKQEWNDCVKIHGMTKCADRMGITKG
tara:strand:- start:8172 stop:9185 length:1014 start_codon:yes stop_codon:yes gene_type:complete